MNINQLRYFVETAKLRNITKAAEKLYISQQTLSKSISQLEIELGVKLFKRTASGSDLTTAGRKVFPIAAACVSKYESYEKEILAVTHHSKSSVHFLLESQVLLMLFPSEFMTQIGEVQIDTEIASNTAQCIENVKNGKVDLAFMTNPPTIEGLDCIIVSQKNPKVAVNRNHKFAAKKELHLQDLKDESFYWCSCDSAFSNEILECCLSEGFYPRIVAEFPDARTQMEGVVSGDGIAIGGDTIVLPNRDQLVRIPLVHEGLLLKLGFLIKAGRKDQLIGSIIDAVKNLLT